MFNFPHNDWVMYMLYVDDIPLLKQMISSAIMNISAQFFNSQAIGDILKFYEPSPTDTVNKLRCKFLVLLDQVSVLLVCIPELHLTRPNTHAEQDEKTRHQLALYRTDVIRGRKAIDPEKADRFYDALHENLLPAWARNEDISDDALIDSVRGSYLES